MNSPRADMKNAPNRGVFCRKIYCSACSPRSFGALVLADVMIGGCPEADVISDIKSEAREASSSSIGPPPVRSSPAMSSEC